MPITGGCVVPGHDSLYLEKAEEHYRLGLASFASGRLLSAMRQLRMASEFGFDRDLVRMRLAVIDRCAGRPAVALRKLEELLPGSGYDGELYLQLGLALLDLERSRDAVEYFRQALKQSSLRWIRVEALRHIEKHVREERLARLIEYAAHGKRMPQDSVNEQRATVWLSWLREERHAAFLKLRELLTEEGCDLQLYRDMAVISWRLGNAGMAVTALRRYRRVFSKEYQASLLHARILYSLDEYASCAAILRKIVDTGNGTNSVFHNLIRCCLRTGMTVAAIRVCKKALAIDPEDAFVLRVLAVIYHNNGSLDTAEEYYRQAFVASPGDFRISFNLGNLLYESGDYINAIRSFQYCLRLNPGFEAAAHNLKFVMMAKICYPEDGPEMDERKKTGVYWIGFAAAAAMVLISVFKGWL